MPTTTPQSTDELRHALQENDQRPYGRTRTVTAEELTEAAEQFDDPELLVLALFELQEAYTYGSEPRKSPVVFARLLNLFDEQPDLFDERGRHQLFWRFKWVANALLALPEMPLGSLRQWLQEMRDRYVKAGLELQPYYGQAYQLASHVGEDTALAYELWAARARTRLSDCGACEICERAQFHLGAGDDVRALREWEPVLAGQGACQEEPARSISYALLPLLRTGDTERARELHLAGYRACRHNPSMSGEVGRHLEFCALTGNEARGLELLSENRSLFEEVESPLDMLDFLTGVEVLLARIEALGHGDLPSAGYLGRTWTVAGLRAEVRGRADDLAARFDARNGTPAHTDRRRARLERAPLLDSLELTLRVRSLDDASPAAVPVAVPAAVRKTAEIPDALPELILKARELDEQGHPDAEAYWARLRTLVAARGYVHPDDPRIGPELVLRADLLKDEGERAGRKDDFATCAALHEEAAGLYEDAGSPGQAAVSHACSLIATAEIPDDDAEKAEALTAAHTAMARLHEETADLTPDQEARLLRLRATALGLRLQSSPGEEHAAAAFAEVAELREFAGRHDVTLQISGGWLLQASTLALTGDLPAAIAELDALQARLKSDGPAWHLPRLHGLRGRLLLGLGDAKAGHEALSEGLREAAGWPAGATDTARLHGELARVSMHLDRPDEALRHLTRSAELHLRDDNRIQAFCTYSNAAQLSLDLGRIEDCIALLDSLLAEQVVTTGELDDRLVAQLRLTRARALHVGEDLKAATAEFAALAAESANWDDDPGSHAMIAAETAVLLGEGGEFVRAREVIAQALTAHAEAPRYEPISNALRELARLQVQQEGPDGLAEALTFLTDAGRIAEEARAVSFEPGGRSLETALAYEYGRVNAYAGQAETALAHLEEALALLPEPEPEGPHPGEWAECVRLASLVEGVHLERAEPALVRLDAAVARLTALGAADEAESLTNLAARLRDER
ncbi:hypothetical protein [Streptomyces sp. NBC_01465]|uniref:hypothetical protein n=1 Tax=Streptomyces sp. NBC_01465 TaxID=2903878 RepID=UPI002E379863|nr:hypothetical protein [Streptomyces sp. NBC_01465]